jgi:hypothetical protein
MQKGYRFWGWLAAVLIGGSLVLAPAVATAKISSCPPFYLKTDDGKIINPLTGEKCRPAV